MIFDGPVQSTPFQDSNDSRSLPEKICPEALYVLSKLSANQNRDMVSTLTQSSIHEFSLLLLCNSMKLHVLTARIWLYKCQHKICLVLHPVDELPQKRPDDSLFHIVKLPFRSQLKMKYFMTLVCSYFTVCDVFTVSLEWRIIFVFPFIPITCNEI